MANSVRAEVGVGASGCPVARASAAAGTTISHVARSATVGSGGTVTEEFAPDDPVSIDDPDLERVAEFDSRGVYRFEREHDRGCVCERVEQHGCPVSDLRARDGTLYVSFYASSIETVQSVVTDLRDAFDGVHVRQLTQTGDRAEHDIAFVDRGRLTERQREVLETSLEMGYFDWPKGANAGEVAAALDIAPSTFSEHLAAAQRKLLEPLLRS